MQGQAGRRSCSPASTGLLPVLRPRRVSTSSGKKSVSQILSFQQFMSVHVQVPGIHPPALWGKSSREVSCLELSCCATSLGWGWPQTIPHYKRTKALLVEGSQRRDKVEQSIRGPYASKSGAVYFWPPPQRKISPPLPPDQKLSPEHL